MDTELQSATVEKTFEERSAAFYSNTKFPDAAETPRVLVEQPKAWNAAENLRLNDEQRTSAGCRRMRSRSFAPVASASFTATRGRMACCTTAHRLRSVGAGNCHIDRRRPGRHDRSQGVRRDRRRSRWQPNRRARIPLRGPPVCAGLAGTVRGRQAGSPGRRCAGHEGDFRQRLGAGVGRSERARAARFGRRESARRDGPRR